MSVGPGSFAAAAIGRQLDDTPSPASPSESPGAAVSGADLLGIAIGGLVLGAVIALVGAVVLTFSISQTRMRRGWVRTTGQVVAMVQPGFNRYHAPMFRYRDSYGYEYVRTGASSGMAPRVGELVRVRYDPRAPHQAVIDRVDQGETFRTMAGGFALGLGLLFVVCFGGMTLLAAAAGG